MGGRAIVNREYGAADQNEGILHSVRCHLSDVNMYGAANASIKHIFVSSYTANNVDVGTAGFVFQDSFECTRLTDKEAKSNRACKRRPQIPEPYATFSARPRLAPFRVQT